MAPDVICAVAEDIILLASNSLAQLYLLEIILDGVGVPGTVRDCQERIGNYYFVIPCFSQHLFLANPISR